MMPLPPPSDWGASASDEFAGRGASLTLDGNHTTGWATSRTADVWLRYDLGATSHLGGAELHWPKAYPKRFAIDLAHREGEWEEVYSTEHGEGRMDLALWRPREARFVQVRLLEAATNRGFGLNEFRLLSADAAPTTLPEALLPALWANAEAARLAAGTDLIVDLRRVRQVAGLRVQWGDDHGTRFFVDVSPDAEMWEQVGEIFHGTGDFDNFYWMLRGARYLRLRLEEAATGEVAQIRELRLRISNKDETPLAKLERAAERQPLGVYPPSLRRHQTYWTLVGTPHDEAEALLDEYGNLELRAEMPMVSPLLVVDGRVRSLAQARRLRHALVEGSLPLPAIEANVDGLTVEVEAFAAWSGPNPVHVRYIVRNTGKKLRTGSLWLTVRPLQVNPEWQHGGLAPIWSLSFDRGAARINGTACFHTEPPADRASVERFDHGDIADRLLDPTQRAEDEDPSGLLSGGLEFAFRLAPGESRSVVLRAAFGELRPNAHATHFEAAREETRAHWRALLGRRRLSVADPAVGETWEAQVAYTLINQNGPALQPGSRNYDRTWIRDGAAHSLLLMQAGLFHIAADYIRWYGERVREDGLVPPILNPDGSVNLGHGSNLEFDAQGQFIFAVAEYVRFTDDQAFLREMAPKVRAAMRFMVELCDRTRAASPAGSRYHGLIAPSISHEGYSKPTHSYWDDFWALRGWQDGGDLLEALGDQEGVAWARAERERLMSDLAASVRKTIADFGLTTLPSSADYGDFDPTSTSIAFAPCECADVLPEEATGPTYKRYLESVAPRFSPGYTGRFTPYELRNVNALLDLGLTEDAHRLLGYLISCRRPAGWAHWAEVVIGDARLADYLGDMPHTWIGAEFCHAVRRCLVREGCEGLELLRGAPLAWLAGRGLELADLPTHRGALSLRAKLREGLMRVEFTTLPPGRHTLWVPASATRLRINGRLNAIPQDRRVALSTS